MDPGTGMTALAIALGGQELLVKLLGPMCEHLAEYPVSATKWVEDNLVRMFRVAQRRADLGTEGNVRPRAFAKIVYNAAMTDDPLAAEYFGGLLASARNEDDDHSTFFADLVGRLSTRQILAHYAVYHKHRPEIVAFYSNAGKDYKELEFNALETITQAIAPLYPDKKERLTAAHFLGSGLVSANLIREGIYLGKVRGGRMGVVRGYTTNPGRLGIELFSAAHGYHFNDFYDLSIPMEAPEDAIPMHVAVADGE